MVEVNDRNLIVKLVRQCEAAKLEKTMSLVGIDDKSRPSTQVVNRRRWQKGLTVADLSLGRPITVAGINPPIKSQHLYLYFLGGNESIYHAKMVLYVLVSQN
jgi:hypothetical protein